MTNPDFIHRYRKMAADMRQAHGPERAMSMAVGGEFEAIGWLEYFLLLQHGLRPTDTLIDVGCGSGRLAVRLRDYLAGRYIGIDVVPELYQYAESLCGRPDWKFCDAPGLTIPEADDSADFICFFSVFTHLTHEQSYRYLADAHRVLKTGGKVVFSFFEFAVAAHWHAFQGVLVDPDPDMVLNQFISRDAIAAWSSHLDFSVEVVNGGDKPHIALGQPVRWSSGAEMRDIGSLGQSVCVLVKP